jgi:outer membrane protein
MVSPALPICVPAARLCVFAAALGAIAAPAFAQTAPPSSSPFGGDWTVTMRGNLSVAPEYPGSDALRTLPFPSIGLRRAGTPERYSAPDDPISFGLLDLGAFRAGPSFRYVGSRKVSDHPELIGLANVPWTLEAGAFMEFWPSEFMRARVDLRYGLRGHQGVTFDMAADGVYRTGAWTMAAGPRLGVASSSYMNAFFGVTAAEAFANPSIAQAFDAEGGLKSAGAAASLGYRFSPQWAATGFARWDRLLGSAADSPVPKAFGSLNQFTFGGQVSYSFDARF